MWVGTCVVLKDSLEESLLSFCRMGSWDLTHIIKLGGAHLYPRSHLISSALVFVFIYLFTYYLFSVLVCVHHISCVVRGQFVRAGSLLSGGSQELSSGCQAW